MSHGLQVEVYQMSWGAAFLGDMLVASTFLAKNCLIELVLCFALSLIQIVWLVLLVAVAVEFTLRADNVLIVKKIESETCVFH
jgi:hypothetical protein